MRKSMLPVAWRTCSLLASLLVASSGCSKSGGPGSSVSVPKPAEAASQLQKAFASAPAEVRDSAAAASEALRAANYDRAVQSLATLNARTDLNARQFMAVHESEAAMVGRLIAAMQSGDPNAKRAYAAYLQTKR